METILDIRGLEKTYKGGVKALGGVDLSIKRGEIFALLGPNGAGKTTLIGAVCGLVRPTGGTIEVFGQDITRNWKDARRRIGLVPQELSFDMFDKVIRQVRYSRGMFGCPPDEARIEEVLRSLSLWDKRDVTIRELSGGMKRRVMIAKALAHDPELLFLDEPTAGVDVELRRDMWRQIDALRAKGVTIILTTHYIEEAEEMADRVGVINKGELLLVDDKDSIMAKLGRTEALFHPGHPAGGSSRTLRQLPAASGRRRQRASSIAAATAPARASAKWPTWRNCWRAQGSPSPRIDTRESTLEDIFVDLLEGKREGLAA